MGIYALKAKVEELHDRLKEIESRWEELRQEEQTVQMEILDRKDTFYAVSVELAQAQLDLAVALKEEQK